MTVFISHTTPDDIFVNKLQAELNMRGYQTWVDHVDMPVGSVWDETVETALDQCSAMILVLSHEALKSPNVKAEWKEFQRLQKPIFPVKIEECVAPMLLRSIHHISFLDVSLTDNVQYEQHLLRLIQALPKPILDEQPLIIPRPPPTPGDTMRIRAEQGEEALRTGQLRSAVLKIQGHDTKPLGDYEGSLIFPEFNKKIAFDFGLPIVVGRLSDMATTEGYIDLDEFDAERNGISRQHAMIVRTTLGVTLTDLGSLNGTFVGRRLPENRIIPRQPARLQTKSMVYFGRLAVQIEFADYST